MSDVKIDFIGNINELLPQLKKVIEEAEKLKETSGDTSKKMGDDFKKAGTSADSLHGKLKDIAGNFQVMGVRAGDVAGGLKKGFEAGTKGAFSFGTAMKSIPILALIGALVSLVSYFTKTEKGSEMLERAMHGVGAVVDVITGVLATFGEVLFNAISNPIESIKELGNFIVQNIINRFTAVLVVLEGIKNLDFSKIADGFIQAGTGIADATSKAEKLGKEFVRIAEEAKIAADAAMLVKKTLQDVGTEERKLDVYAAIRKNDVDLLIKQSRDHNLTIGERIDKLKQAAAIDKEVLTARLSLANLEVKAQKTNNDLEVKAKKIAYRSMTQELADALKKRANLEGNSAELQQKLENSITSMLQGELDKRAEAKKKNDEAELELKKNTDALLKKLAEDAAKAEIDGKTGLEKLDAERDFALKEIKILEDTLIARKALSEKAAAQITILRDATYAHWLEQTLKQGEEENKALKDASNKRLEIREKTAIEEVKLLNNPGMSLAAFEESKQKIILQIQIDYAKKRLDRLASDNSAEANLQKLQIRNQIKSLESELNKINSKQKTLAERLGLTPEEAKKMEQNLKIVANNVASILNSMAQAKVDAADQAIEAARRQAEEEIELSEERLRRLESDLDSEKDILSQELNNKSRGYANDVNGARERVRELQKQKQAEFVIQEKARADEKAAVKKAEVEKRKALAQQRSIETASQAISIVTASANILKGFSTLPFIGQVLGIAAVAAMIGSFIASKARISSATSGGFRKGGFTGNIGIDQEAGAVHGQEFVFTAEKTKKHRKFFEELHNDRITDAGIHSLLKGTGVYMKNDVPRRFNSLVSESKTHEVSSKLNKSVEKIESNTSIMADKAQEKKVEFFDGYRIETIGNIKRKING